MDMTGRRERTSTCLASKTSRFRRCFALFASRAAAMRFSAFSRAMRISSFFLAFLTCVVQIPSRREDACRLSDGRVDGVAATRSREDAIAATASVRATSRHRTAPARSESAQIRTRDHP